MLNYTNYNYLPDDIFERTFILRGLLYLVTPDETSPATLEDVPDVVAQVIPIFFFFIVLEGLICQFRWSKGRFRFNDSLASMSHATCLRVFELIGEVAIEYHMYILAYEKFHFFEMKPESRTTWILALLGADLSYYWAHRAMHEVNLMWSAHQVHHSGEDYNLAMGMRQSIFQRYTSWPFYIPLALLGVPPQSFIMHHSMGLLYQFWIHTELVDGLGDFLNYFLNVPKHHQVHHGRNPYCIDKNYGACLIIWDRMFGTFADRDADSDYEDEKIAYGLIPPVNSFGYFKVQFHSLKKLIRRFFKTKGFSNKMKVIFYGPGWNPQDNLRLGDPAKLPRIKKGDEKKFHDPYVSGALGFYGLVQIALTAFVLDHFLNLKTNEYSFALNSAVIIWIFWAMCSVTIMVEGITTYMEIFRCILTSWFFLDATTFPERIHVPDELYIPFVLSIFASIFLKFQNSFASAQNSKIKAS